MEPADLLFQRGVAPALLEPAPPPPARRETLDRVAAWPPRPCSACGTEAVTARAVTCAGAGPRWVDLCRDHALAVRRPSRVPATLEGIAADLYAAAEEAGLSRVTFYSSFEAAAVGRPEEDPQ
ncbi:hypothetical protein [Streptomyces thinghirensis]|uniref:Uncharacterized protein n=1 Tax=Streptomyces thinghirensis TaxID=551547 RepID=A0ABP9TEU2_9ACTN